MDVKTKGSGWPLGKKALACVMALSLVVSVPLPRQEAVAEEFAPAQVGQLAPEDSQSDVTEDASVEGMAALTEKIDALESEVDPDDPSIEGNYQYYGYYTDRIGIRWAYEVRKDGTANISGRANSPDRDGENWVIPEVITDENGDHTVTTMVGSTLGPNNWFFNGGNANSITFPASITRMRDTFDHCFLTSLCFSGYESADKRVFFLGKPPADLNWERDIASSDLRMTIDTPYPEEWAKDVPSYWTRTKFRSYTAPTGFYPQVLGDDGEYVKIKQGGEIEIPVNGGKLIHVVNQPTLTDGTSFYKWHSHINYSSSNSGVSVWNNNGWVWALSSAHPGETATITMENGLFQTYKFKVKVTEEVKDAMVKDVNGVDWRFKENEDGTSDESLERTATLTELVNKQSYAGKDLVVPSSITSGGVTYTVTQVGGPNFYGDEESVLEGVEAKSVTFPTTIRAITDQSSRFFYNMIEQGGKIFFLGAPPAIDWETITGDRGPNGLVVRSIQEWSDAGCPWYGTYAYTMEEYDGPEGLEIERDGAQVDGTVELPIGTSARLDAVSVPEDDNYYAGHVAVRWESSNPQVEVTDEGVVTAANGAESGQEATLTATSALGYQATCTVELGAAPTPVDITGCDVSLADGFEVYKGASLFFPTFSVKNGDKVLTVGTDYSVSFEDDSGTAVAANKLMANKRYELVLTGEGLFYKGTKKISFTVSASRVPVAGWSYSVANGTATINGYQGTETGTVVVPAYIGASRVTKIATGAFSDKAITTLVVPDSVTEGVDASTAKIGTVRTGGTSSDGKWKYFLKYDMYGNPTGVLGSAAPSPSSACLMASSADADFTLPTEIDGVQLSVIGTRALASDADDGSLLDFNVVHVPASYIEVQDGAFDHLDAVLVFEGAAPTKTGDGAVAVQDWSGLPKPEILYPQGASGWDVATATYGSGNWASANSRGSYNPRYRFTFVSNESGVGKDAYITGYNGSPRGVWMYPYGDTLSQMNCQIGYQSLGGFKDAHIDATRLTQITVPGGIDKIEGTAFENIDPENCDEIYFSTLVHQQVPAATDYKNAFKVKEGAKAEKLSITCPAINYQAWKNSEWATYYNIKIHMVSAPSLFDYDEVTVTRADGKSVDGLAVTGYHGLETSVAVPSWVDGVVRDGVTYEGPVVAIADSAFEGSSVSAVNIPGTVVSIGSYAFHNRGVSYVNIEEGVEHIGTWCFWGCSALEEITLPASLKSIGEAPFGVSGLKNVYVNKVEGETSTFEDDNGVLFTANHEKLVYYPLKREETRYSVPVGTKAIGKFAFRGAADMYVNAYNLTELTLPASLEEIEEFAFQQFDELTAIEIPSSVTRIGEYAFQSCTNMRSVNIPSGITEIPEGFVEFCESVSEIDVPAGVTKIGEDAFFSMGALNKVTLPEGLEVIDSRAFGGCPSLASINLPSTLKRVGNSCFISDSSIKELRLENTSLEQTGAGAFAGLTGVKHEIVIPATMKDLGTGTFSGMHNVPKVSFAEGFSMTELGDGVFSNMSGLEWITIPEMVAKVGANLFFETAVKREDADSKFHVVFLNQGEWECDLEQTTFAHFYDTIQQAYVYGYGSSSTKRNISDSDGELFYGIYWRPIDIDVSTEWADVSYAEPNKEFKLVVNARAANGDLGYVWKVDGQEVSGMSGEVFTFTFSEKARHLVSVDVVNSFDPKHPKTISTTVDVTDPGDVQYSLTRAKVDAIPVQVWSSGQVKPKPRITYEGIVLKEGTDYTLAYANNAGVGTGTVFATGAGKYVNIVSASFAIVGATQDALMDAIASAKVDRLGVMASDDGFGLAAGTWYAPKAHVTALDSAIKSATAVALAAKPSKAQIATAAKTLQTAQSAFNAAKAKATGNEKPGVQAATVTVKDQVYSGKALKPAVTVKRNGKALVNGTDYTVAYSSNKNVGAAKVTVTGKGAYVGTKTAAFKIKPKGTSVSKLTPAAKKLTVKWAKQATQTTGYEILLATNAAFTANKKTVKVAKASTTSKAVTGLKAKTKYYVKVRTYKTVGGATYYSDWSAAKNAKTK